MADDNNEFALNVYGQLRKRPGNLFLSPFSIRTVLAMAQAGAKGVTAAQMSEVLSASPQSELPHLDGGGQCEIAVANALWAQEGEPLRREYLDVIASRYGGVVHLVDFRNAEAARVTINQWIEDKTRRKIRELVPSNALDALTGLVLVNAIYFKGAWERPFSKAVTSDEPFYLDGGGEVQAPQMHLLTHVRYVHAEGCQAIDLAYRGDLSMLVLLPDRKNRLLDLEEKISARVLHNWVLRMQTCFVEVSLPRFEITAGPFNLRERLSALGMPAAFDPSVADFSGINGRKPPDEKALFISALFHTAVVETNEEGTEAAAVSKLVMRLGASPKRIQPRQVFRADHPFLFAIRDRKSGALLFLGRVSDPTKKR